MTTSPQLQLSPSAFTVKIDGVTIEAGTWDKALSLLSQQSALRRKPVTFGVYGSEGGQAEAAFTIDGTGTLTREPAGAEQRASLQLGQWNISRVDGPSLIAFSTMAAATEHIQLVADITGAPIPVLFTGYYIQDRQQQFTPDGAGTGSLPALSQEELESNLLSADSSTAAQTGSLPVVDETQQSEEAAPVSETEPAVIVPAGTVAPEPEPKDEPLETFLFEEPEQTTPSKTPLWHKLSEATRSIETPAILEPTRNKIIVGGAVAALVLSIVGISAAVVANTDTAATAGISDTVLSVPAGYSDSPIWSLTLPEDAHVKATGIATALMTDTVLSLYDSSTGEKIRDIDLTAPITTFGEATVSGKPALIWRAGNTLTAWIAESGADGQLISTELESGSTLSGTGQELLVLTPDTSAALTADGLIKYKLPAGYTAMAATEQGLIAGNFTPTVLTVDTKGQTVREVNLQAPHEGQQLHSWKHADASITATVWAQDPNAECDSSSRKGCSEEVTVAIHKLSDGTLISSYDMTLEDVANLSWVDGEGDQYGALGSYVFDEATGQQVTVLPEGLTAEKIKGQFSMSTDKDGASLVFHSNYDGYQLSSVLLAETSSSVIVQQGDRVIAYPLAIQ